MDVEVALPSGNIGDDTEDCDTTLDGYTCATPESGEGKKDVIRVDGTGGADV